MEVDVEEVVPLAGKLAEVDAIMNRQLEDNEYWYVLDNKWFQTYAQFLRSGDPSSNPGPIDNGDLFKPDVKPVKLKENLAEHEDYVYVPPELWDLLVKEFNLIDEKQVIPRKVIDRPSARTTYKVLELYPIELKLCLHGTKQEIKTAQFCQSTTLKELESVMRKLFNVPPKSETQLWACGSILNAHEPSEPKKNDDQTLVQASLASGAIVTLEVQNSDGSWPTSRPRFGAIATRSSKITPGLCGLMNLGNTCFMNSALQCLSNTAPLTEYFVGEKYWDELNVDNPLGMGGEIAKTYGDLIKAMWSGLHSFLSPREFKQAVGKFSPQFSGFQQQDCQELMAFLLDGLHEDLNRVKKKPYIEIKQEIDKRPDTVVAAESWSNYLKRNDSIIVDTFHGLLKSTLVCPECDLVSVTFDPYCYLSLPLPVKRERAIDVMFVPAKPITVGPEKKLKQIFKLCKLMVPKVGLVLDICNAVAKAISESKEVNGFTVNPSNLIVTEVNNCRLSRIYLSDDSFTSNTDEVHIFEKLDGCTALPVYLRWAKGEDSATLFGKPFFVNITECTHKALYSAVKNYVESLTEESIIPEMSSPSSSSAVDEKAVEPKLVNLLDVVISSPEGSCTDSDFEMKGAYQGIIGDIPASKWLDQPAVGFPASIEKPCNLLDIVISSPSDSDSDEKCEARKDVTAEDILNGSGTATEEMETISSTQLNYKTPSSTATSATTVSTSLPSVSAPSTATATTSRNNHDSSMEGGNRLSATTQPGQGSPIHADPGSFTLKQVNSFGTMTLGIFEKDRPLDLGNKTYIAADFPKRFKIRPYDNEETTLRLNLQRNTNTTSKSHNLSECIEQFTTTERLGEHDLWYCPRCKKRQQASKKFDIWSLPKVAIFHLKRFSYSKYWRDKLDTLVNFPLYNLDLGQYLINNPTKEKILYNLIAVANHYGGLGGGHYTAYGKNKETGSWHHFDDSNVSPATEDSVVSKAAYVLLYLRQE